MKKERVEYLDLLKCISILLVVFCHYCMMPDETVLGNIVMCLAWAAVPCFFLASGGLMHASKSWNWKKYFKKLVRVYLVLIIWKVIYLIVYMTAITTSFTGSELVNYLFFFGDIQGINTGVMWFMYAYVMILLIYPLTYVLFKNGKKGKQAILFGIAILFILCFLQTGINFVLQTVSAHTGNELSQISFAVVNPFGQYGNMLFFFLVGAFLFRYREEIIKFLRSGARRLLPWIGIAIGVGIYMTAKYLEYGTWRWEGIYMTDGYARIGVLFMAFGMYLAVMMLPVKGSGKWIASCIGTNTQGIYYMHYLMLAMLELYLGEAYMRYASFGMNVVKTVVTALVCMAISMLIKKIPVVRHLMG